MKCLFGFPMYGRNTFCPSNLPSIPECREFYSEYQDAVVFLFEKKVNKPEDRAAWTKQINLRLVELEREVLLSGYEKAFVLPIDCCDLCDKCSGDMGRCKNSKMSSPAIEAFNVYTYRTLRKIGYPLKFLCDYMEPMNYYMLRMIKGFFLKTRNSDFCRA